MEQPRQKRRKKGRGTLRTSGEAVWEDRGGASWGKGSVQKDACPDASEAGDRSLCLILEQNGFGGESPCGECCVK